MKDTCILGLHIAKTGGTSILYNFRTNLAPEASFNYGHVSNVNRFLTGQPLLEDIAPNDLLNLKFIFGHGVHEGLLRTLPHPDLALFCVFRDPYLHMLSHFKHQTRMGANDGTSITPGKFLEQRSDNPASRFVVAHFPTLAGEGDLRTQVLNVLKHFRFVLSTDNLTEQSVGLFRLAGVPPITSKRRVYPEVIELPGLSREDVYAANAVDYEINQAINAIQDDPEQAVSWNPFGYDPEAFTAARENMRRTISDKEQRQHYHEMIADQLRRGKSVLAAQEYSRQQKMTGDIAEMVESLPHGVYTPENNSSEQVNFARILHNGGKSQKAVAALEKAIALNTNNVTAYFMMSKIYFELHGRRLALSKNSKLSKSLTMAVDAAKRAPNRGDIQAHLGEIYLEHNDLNTAIAHYMKAVELAPDNAAFKLKLSTLMGRTPT